MILGIDLGTTNSLGAVFRNGQVELVPNAFGDYLTPSVVGMDANGEMVVGKVAKERLITFPDQTVSQFKRFMGSKHDLYIGDRAYKAEELSSFIIRKLIEDAESYTGEKVEEVIVSVPAYFNDSQRYATKLAGQLAGIKIERIINEPSAAALARHRFSQSDQSYVVIDFGGGTLDISVVEAFDNVVEIIAIAGDNRLGGEDFTQVIADEFLNHFHFHRDRLDKQLLNKILIEAEKAKLELNIRNEVSMNLVYDDKELTYNLTYRRFFEICQNLLARVKTVLDKALFDAKYQHVSANSFILVGGTSQMRLVQDYITYLIKQPLQVSENPALVIAQGCGMVAGIKSRSEEVRDFLLSDICPFTLGMEIEGGKYSPIIERNSPLPASKVERYYTVQLGQEYVQVNVYQGEQMTVSKNLKLGSFEVPVPINHEYNEAIDVRFTYDLNSILDIDITVVSTKEVFSHTILQESVHLTAEEIELKREELKTLKIKAQDTEIYQFLIEKANRLYMMLLGQEREMLSMRTRWFEQEASNIASSRLPQLYKNFSDFLDSLERGSFYS